MMMIIDDHRENPQETRKYSVSADDLERADLSVSFILWSSSDTTRQISKTIFFFQRFPRLWPLQCSRRPTQQRHQWVEYCHHYHHHCECPQYHHHNLIFLILSRRPSTVIWLPVLLCSKQKLGMAEAMVAITMLNMDTKRNTTMSSMLLLLLRQWVYYNCDHQTISQKATNCISEFFSDLQIQLPGMDCVIWIQNLSNAQDKHGCMKCALGTRPKQWTLDIDWCKVFQRKGKGQKI